MKKMVPALTAALILTAGITTASAESPDNFKREITVSPARQPLPHYSTELQRFGVEGTVVLTGVPLHADENAMTSSSGLIVAVGDAGELLIGGSTWPACRAMHEHLVEVGYEDPLFVPAGDHWLVVTPDSTPMAQLIFQDTEIVRPGVWGAAHRQAQQQIDELGLTRHYVQVRHYLERDRPNRR